MARKMAKRTLLVAGLGNPGEKYRGTRHNIGFLALDRLAERLGAGPRDWERKWKAEFVRRKHAAPSGESIDLALLKPQDFMNRSGESVAPAAKFFKVDVKDCLVLHDEVELPFAEIRLKEGGGHKGHNGLRDIIARAGSSDFYRLRLGVDRPEGRDVAAYVLSDFSKGEFAQMDAFLDAAADEVLRWIDARAVEAGGGPRAS